MKPKLILIVILLIATVTRFWGLSIAPVSPNWDEVSLGYNAYSILKTGRDEWGTFLPTIFPAFGDYKLPVFVYASVPVMAIFGLNIFSIRFISALSGVVAVYGIYLLTNLVFKKAKTPFNHQGLSAGHFSALILSLLPWHIFLSRPALEANLGLPLYLFGLYFLFSSLNKTAHLIYSASLLGLAMHTYNSYRVLVPLTAVLFLVFYFKKIAFKSYYFWISLVIAILASTLVISQIKNGQGLARYEKLKILNTNTIYQIGQARQNSNLPEPLPKLIHNRPVFFTTQVVKNYFSYFTPQFWNQSRGAQYQFAIPGKNLVTYPVLALCLLGLFFVLKTKSKTASFFVVLFFLSPLAASFTNDPPQAIRPSPLIIFVCLFFAFGLYHVQSSLKRHQETVICLVISLFAISSVLYLKNYWYNYQLQYSSSWQYGYKQVFDYISKNGHNDQNVFVTKKYGEPHIFDFFFNKADPVIVQNKGETIRFSKSDWLWTDKFQNHYFVNDWQIPVGVVSKLSLESGLEISTANSLLITTPDHVPSNSTILGTINFLDGSIAFIILQVQ